MATYILQGKRPRKFHDLEDATERFTKRHNERHRKEAWNQYFYADAEKYLTFSATKGGAGLKKRAEGNILAFSPVPKAGPDPNYTLWAYGSILNTVHMILYIYLVAAAYITFCHDWTWTHIELPKIQGVFTKSEKVILRRDGLLPWIYTIMIFAICLVSSIQAIMEQLMWWKKWFPSYRRSWMSFGIHCGLGLLLLLAGILIHISFVQYNHAYSKFQATDPRNYTVYVEINNTATQIPLHKGLFEYCKIFGGNAFQDNLKLVYGVRIRPRYYTRVCQMKTMKMSMLVLTYWATFQQIQVPIILLLWRPYYATIQLFQAARWWGDAEDAARTQWCFQKIEKTPFLRDADLRFTKVMDENEKSPRGGGGGKTKRDRKVQRRSTVQFNVPRHRRLGMETYNSMVNYDDPVEDYEYYNPMEEPRIQWLSYRPLIVKINQSPYARVKIKPEDEEEEKKKRRKKDSYAESEY